MVLLDRPATAASLRQLGQHWPAVSANPTRHCSVKCRCRRTVRYRSKRTGTKASMTPPGAAAPAWKRLALGTLLPQQESGLAKIGDFGETRLARDRVFPASAGMQTRL